MDNQLYQSTALSALTLAGIAFFSMAQPAAAQVGGGAAEAPPPPFADAIGTGSTIEAAQQNCYQQLEVEVRVKGEKVQCPVGTDLVWSNPPIYSTISSPSPTPPALVGCYVTGTCEPFF